MTNYQRFEHGIEVYVTDALRSSNPLDYFSQAHQYIYSQNLQERSLAWDGVETILNSAINDLIVQALIREEVLKEFVKRETDEKLQSRKAEYVGKFLSRLKTTRESIREQERMAREREERNRRIQRQNAAMARNVQRAGSVLGVAAFVTLGIGGFLLLKSLLTGQISHDIQWAYCASGIKYGKECAEVVPDWGFNVGDYTTSAVVLNPRGQFDAPGTLFFAPAGENTIEILNNEQIYKAQLSPEGFRFVDITNRIAYHTFLRVSLSNGKIAEIEIIQDFWKKHGSSVSEFRYGTIAGYPVWNFKYDGVNSEDKPVSINAVIILGAKEHAEIQLEMERQFYRPKV